MLRRCRSAYEPCPYGSSAMQRFQRSDAVYIRNRIIVYFYMGLPQIIQLLVNLTAVDHMTTRKRKMVQFVLCIAQFSLQCTTLSMYRFVQQFIESLDPVVFDTYVDIFGTWLEVCEMCHLLHLQVN